MHYIHTFIFSFFKSLIPDLTLCISMVFLNIELEYATNCLQVKENWKKLQEKITNISWLFPSFHITFKPTLWKNKHTCITFTFLSDSNAYCITGRFLQNFFIVLPMSSLSICQPSAKSLTNKSQFLSDIIRQEVTSFIPMGKQQHICQYILEISMKLTLLKHYIHTSVSLKSEFNNEVNQGNDRSKPKANKSVFQCLRCTFGQAVGCAHRHPSLQRPERLWNPWHCRTESKHY